MGNGSETDGGSPYRQGPGAVTTIGAIYAEAAGLRRYREASAGTCEISSPDDPRSFRALSQVHHLGNAVLADVRSSSLRYLRSAHHVARAAYDHYQITFNLSGHIHYRSGPQSANVAPDDIIILDSARETDAHVHAPEHGLAHTSVLFVPRAALAPLLRVPGGGHLLVLRREQALAVSLRDHLRRILRTIQLEPRGRMETAVENLVELLVAGVGGGRELPPALRHSVHRSATDSLKRLIERRLDSPALSIELLCSHSGWSRATVYRLLEADGGPIRYIRQRRLQRAFRELISRDASGRPILELALRHRFAGEATFNRAFRRTFGIPPGKVRDLAAHSRWAVTVGSGDERARAIDWIKTLGDAAAQLR